MWTGNEAVAHKIRITHSTPLSTSYHHSDHTVGTTHTHTHHSQQTTTRHHDRCSHSSTLAAVSEPLSPPPVSSSLDSHHWPLCAAALPAASSGATESGCG